MAEPQGDGGQVELGSEEAHGAGMSEGVGCDPLVPERFASLGGGSDVFVDEVLDGVDAETSTAAGGEERIAGAAPRLSIQACSCLAVAA